MAAADLAAIILVLSGSSGKSISQLVADLTGVLGAVAAAATFVWTGLGQAGEERRWRWLTAFGLAWFATAHALWAWYRSFDPMTFPNAANALYLGLPLFSFLALLSMINKDHDKAEEYESPAPSRKIVVLDGIIIVGSLLALMWKIALDIVQQSGRVPVGRLLMVTSYTVAHLVLIVIAILFAIALRSLLRVPLAWVVAGLAVIGVSDAVYIYTISNSLMPSLLADVGYMIGPIFFLMAALAPHRRLSRITPRASLLFVPYFPFAIVCGFTLFTTISTGRANVGDVYALVAIIALVVLRQIITVRQLHTARQQLAYQATHDPLTGARTRNLLLFQLNQALSRAPRSGALGLLYADLDHFKEINDLLGHDAGDIVLRTAADRLTSCIRSTDTLARMGGDEFVVLFDPAPKDPHELGERILSVFEDPIWVNESRLTVGASFGYVGLNDDESSDEALARADETMYQAKGAGQKGKRIKIQISES